MINTAQALPGSVADNHCVSGSAAFITWSNDTPPSCKNLVYKVSINSNTATNLTLLWDVPTHQNKYFIHRL